MKVPTCRFGIIGFVASPGAFDNCHFLRGLESRTCCKMCKSSNQPGSRVAQQNSAIDLGPIGPSHKMVVTAKHGTASNPYRIRYRYRWVLKVLKSSKISPNSSWNFSPCMNKGTLKSSFTSLQEPPQDAPAPAIPPPPRPQPLRLGWTPPRRSVMWVMVIPRGNLGISEWRGRVSACLFIS